MGESEGDRPSPVKCGAPQLYLNSVEGAEVCRLTAWLLTPLCCRGVVRGDHLTIGDMALLVTQSGTVLIINCFS